MTDLGANPGTPVLGRRVWTEREKRAMAAERRIAMMMAAKQPASGA